ncbi:ABC transporter substrate-binding protein [Methylobacter sp. Wu8]|uniref:ABC transporter substrate-binding protein n=1 Tax=Methylobacter sp. Wu8 TaxID=3118457 RepID=UPI002F346FF1
MFKKVIVVLLIITAFVLGYLLGINKDKTEYESIKIGVVIFKTGGAAQYGEWIKNGLDMAQEEINANDFLVGKKIELIYEDDKTDSKVAVSAINKLISIEKTQIIIAGVTSSSALSIAPIAEKNKVVLFSPCSSNPQLTNAGDYIFRNWPSDNAEGEEMAKFAHKSYKKIAVISMNNDFSLGLRDIFIDSFKKLGGEVTFSDSFQSGTSDFRSIVTKLKTVQYDAIYLPAHAFEAANFIKQSKEMGVNTQFLGVDTYESPEFIKIAGNSSDGVIYTNLSFNPALKSTTVENFSNVYFKKYGQNPEIYSAQSYDALKIIALAIKKAGDSASGAVKAQLYDIKDYDGVSGLTSFDSNGDVTKPAIIKHIKDGQFLF